jgi:hypothetical protein
VVPGLESSFGIPIPIPNPFSLIPGLGGGGGLLGGLFSGLGSLIEQGIASAARSAFKELEKLINNSAGSISFGPHSWWATKVNTGASSIWPTVLTIALAVLLGCLILAVIQGAFSGDPMIALRATIVEVPRSIFGMATVVALTGVLVTVVDGASAAVLPNVGANFGDWFAKSGSATGFFGGFVSGLVLLGALLTWVELVVRQGLVFLLVALSPMALAVRVWPAAAGLWRRFAELGVALIVSKFVIALALALGSDALAGSVDGSNGASLTAMTTGAGLMLVAALSPFVILRVIPGVEGAMAAQGISRMPVRAAMTAASTATSVALLTRLAASHAGAAATPQGGAAAGSGSASSRPPMAAAGSLARAAALDARSRPAIGPAPGRALPPAANGASRGGDDS